MKKFEYGLAYYHATGIIEAHSSMFDLACADGGVGPFLHEAGAKGWELCGLLPMKDAKGYDACAVFKRETQD